MTYINNFTIFSKYIIIKFEQIKQYFMEQQYRMYTTLGDLSIAL